MDDEALAEAIAFIIKSQAEEEMRDKGFDVSMRVKESYHSYCVIELHLRKPPSFGNVMSWLSPCCETGDAMIWLTEKSRLCRGFR